MPQGAPSLHLLNIVLEDGHLKIVYQQLRLFLFTVCDNLEALSWKACNIYLEPMDHVVKVTFMVVVLIMQLCFICIGSTGYISKGLQLTVRAAGARNFKCCSGAHCWRSCATLPTCPRACCCPAGSDWWRVCP